MKRLAFIVGLVSVLTVGLTVTGCKTVPGADTVRTVAKAGGVATGISLNFCDIDAEAGTAITNIVTRLKEVTPNEGETLEDAWIRTAQVHTDILVARGDLTPRQGAMVMAGFRLAVKGYDLLLVYYPQIALYAELTAAAIDGFSEGFLATYKPGCDSCTIKSYPAMPDGRVLEGLRSSREFQMLKK